MPEKKLPLIISSEWFMVLWPSISAAGRMQRNGFFLLQVLSKKVDGKHYLETDSIIAFEQVTMNIMNS